MVYEASSFECSRIAQDLQIRKVQVECAVQLFNENNSVPFIARYRRALTGGLEEETLRQIHARLNSIKQLNDRKQTILRAIENQGKLSDDLRFEIVNAPTVRRLEDLYLPFKPRKKGLAVAARDKGLEPAALALWHGDPALGNLDEFFPTLINPEKQLNTVDEVKLGVQHIIAELINETAEVRAQVRRALWKTGTLTATKHERVPEGQGNEFKPYFQFKEAAQEIRPHRILALNRGEKEGVLKVKLEWPAEPILQRAALALAEHLLKVAGTPMAPPAPTSAEQTLAPSPTEQIPPPIPEVASVSTETAAPAPAEQPALAQAAPLVETLVAPAMPLLTGEPLAEGCEFRSPHVAFLKACLDDALNRILLPGLEREIRHELTDEAELHAIKICAHNVRSLLMQRPMVGRRVLAIDPGYRNGCRLAALDEQGQLLEHAVIYPHGGPGGGRKSKEKKAPEQPAPASASPPAEAASADAPAATEAPAASPPAEAARADASATPAVTGPVTVPEPSAPPPTVEALAPPPVDRRAEARGKLAELVVKHNLNVIALGNGAASRETEEFISEVISSSLTELSYVIVSEAGASAYAVSSIAKEELPNLEAGIRSSVSIGRRLQDPLGELVKVEPLSLGVGLYQHDMGRQELKEALEAVVESCVNHVGIDVNTASVPLLRQVAGCNQMVARELIERRKNHGPFTSREQLTTVISMTPARFAQAAGFLKVPSSTNPLDRVWVHPESYAVAEKVIAELGYTPAVLDDRQAHPGFREKLNQVNLEELAKKVETDVITLDGILHALARPGRDPRDEQPPPILKKGILKLEDLQAGMELKGTVLNVVDFGAFVDVGLKDSGLVHISQMANKYIKSPYDVVSVNDIVRVWVMKIDKDSNHVSLTMIAPGTERKPLERGGSDRAGPRREGEARPPERREFERGAPRPVGPSRREGGAPREDRGPRQHGRPPRGRGGPPREVQRESAPPPPPPPRKPKRDVPMPKLTQAAIEGKAPLRTLGELAAFFAAKEEKDKAPSEPVPEVKQETPPEPTRQDPSAPTGETPPG